MIQKIILLSVVMLGLSACNSSKAPPIDPVADKLAGLAECVVPAGNDKQALVCGKALAADGLTPLVGANIGLKKLATRELAAIGVGGGVEDPDKCLSDAVGDFACLLPEDVTGDVTLVISSGGFVAKEFDVSVTPGEFVVSDPQQLGGDDSNKWVVIPGVYDGVQVLLAQLKGCTLNGSDGNPFPAGGAPETARGSADCEAKGLKVLGGAEGEDGEGGDAAVTAFLASNELLDYDSLFVNCPANYSSGDNNSLLNSFVSSGGHVYFSDLSDSWLTDAFPNKITIKGNNTHTGTLTATVKHAGLKAVIGHTVDIVFDLNVWTAIESVAEGVTTFIEGDISSVSSYDAGTYPITVGWKNAADAGCVFYSSYHVEGAATAETLGQENAMKYLVQNLSAVCQ